MPKTFTNATFLMTGPKAVNNDAFYRVVTEASFQGVEFVNTFYYRVGLGLLPFGLNFGGAEALANTFKNQVWTDNIKDIVPITYRLQTITVYPYNGDFDPITNLPFVLTVNEAGNAVGSSMGPASCAIVAFNLEGTTIGQNGWFPPKRGYMAYGPLREGDVDEAGRFTPTALNFYNGNLAVTATDLYNAFSLVSFWPCRISARKILGIFTLRGFTDISGVSTRAVQKWRRSRIVEA